MSPGVALGYLFWTRHRRGLMVVAVYLLLLVIVCRLVLGETFASTLDKAPGSEAELYIRLASVFFLCPGLAIAVAYLLCIFAFSREVRRFEGCESGFPLHLRHLPLPARALAGWPMLWGSATMVLVWLVLAWGALRPCGFNVPLGWPALLLAVALAWLQAIIWTPFPLPWVRALLFIPVSGLIVFVPMALLAFDVSTILGYLLLAGLLPAAYWAAICGVSRARRGENEYWRRPAWLRWPWTRTHMHPPFPSAARAQLWLEWQRGRIAFPVGCVLSWLTIYLFVLTWSQVEERLWLFYFLLISGLCLATVCGVLIGAGPVHQRGKDFSSFLATRPLSTGMLARAKFETAMLTTFAGWAGMIVGLMLWLALSGLGRETVTEWIEEMRQRYPEGQFWVSLALLAGGSVVLIWMQMAGTLWVTMRCGIEGDHPCQSRFLQMAGYLWLGFLRQVWSIGSVLLIGAVVLLMLFDGQAVRSSESWRTFTDLLLWLASGVMILKMLAAVWSLSRLRREALVPPSVLIAAVAAWSALAISLLIALRWLVPGESFPTSGLVLGILVFQPLTRLALVPLALAWNRHR